MPLALLLLGCPPGPVEIPPPAGPPLGSSGEWRKELAQPVEVPEVIERQHLRDMIEEVCPPSAGDLKWPRMSPAARQTAPTRECCNPWVAAKEIEMLERLRAETAEGEPYFKLILVRLAQDGFTLEYSAYVSCAAVADAQPQTREHLESLERVVEGARTMLEKARTTSARACKELEAYPEERPKARCDL